MKRRKAWICPFCKKTGTRTRHHILPKRHYRNSPFYAVICRKCHNKLEVFIPQEYVPPVECFYIVWTFYKYGPTEASAYLSHRERVLTEVLDKTNK
jgi:ribosomal protein S27E